MSKLGNEKRDFLWDIIEKQIEEISTSESYYKDSLHSLDDYEYICNCCLEIFERNIKYRNVEYYSSKEIGKKTYEFLVDLKEWLEDILDE